MTPDLLAHLFTLRALAQAFLTEFDRLESRLAQKSPLDPGDNIRSVDATDDKLNAELRRKIAETYPQGEVDPNFSTDIAEPTPEQLERVRRRQKEQQQPKPTAEMTPQQKANLKLVKDYIQANSDGGDHAG